MFALNFRRGAAVVEQLLERFGADRLDTVEQLSPHSFRAYLSGGGIAVAVMGDDGMIHVKEPDVRA